MKQDSEQMQGKNRFDRNGFCRADFGKAEEFDAALMDESDWRGPLEQLGTLEFHGTRATIYLENWEAKVQFSNLPELRDARSRCQALASGSLPICRLSRARNMANENRDVKVHIIYAGEQRHLPGNLHFSVNESVAAQAKWTGDPKDFPRELVKSLSFRTGKGWVLLARFSGILGDSHTADPDLVELFNSDGELVVCRIQCSTVAGWLEVIEYQPDGDDKKKGFWKAPTVRLLGFDQAPVFDQEQKGGELLPLEALRLKGSTFLGCWRRYRELLKTMHDARFVQRENMVLTFRVGMSDPEDPSCHRVNIANWQEARDAWGEIKEVPVYVAKDQPGLGDEDSRSKVTLVEVGLNGDARIRWDGAAPCDQGLIMVAEESSANDRRTKDAIGRLQQGTSALPDLMNLLNDPTVTPAPRKMSPKLGGSIPYDDSQKEAIYKALGNQSIVAIQGPPGTGKTRVIVGIIKQLYRKCRSVADSAAQSPFRVLISSAQNVAVSNAVDLLANEGILIDQRLSDTARKVAESASRVVDMRDVGAQISQRVRRRLENEPHLRFQAEQAQAVDQLLRELIEVERSASVAESLPDALARFRSSFHSLPLELMSRIERHADCLAVPLPVARNFCGSDESIDRLSRFLAEIQEVGPASEIPDDVTEWEADFDLVGLSEHYEKLGCLVRDHRRATRDGDDQSASASRAEIQGLATSLHGTLATRISKADLEEQVDQEAPARAILAELQEELTEYRRILFSQKGGVLAQWCQALEEQPGLWKKLVEKYAEVRGATCQMAAPSPNPLEPNARYDLVVMDEAARTDPGEILIPLTLGAKLLLVGDQKQLPPFIDELAARKLQQEDASGLDLLREQSFFQELFEALPETNKTILNRQYRSHPFIGEAVSRAFYDGKLQSGPSLPTDFARWAAEKVPIWGLFENHPLCWLDTDLMAPRAPCDNLNPDESDLAVRILGKVIASLDTNEKQIGVITFYREQLNHLRAQLERAIPNHSRLLELDTVDSFQGKEFPLVILLTSRRDPARGRVGFLNLPNRVNVAVSRAQRQLVILGSRETLLHSSGGSNPFKAFVSAARSNLKFAGPNLQLLKP